MKSKEIYQTIICDLNCKFGAPMGRSNAGEKPNNQKVFCRRVPLDAGGYDKGGAYWGIGSPLYVEYSADGTYIKFFRK